MFHWLFDTSGFPPRWQCGTWSRELGWLHITSDLLIFGAYFSIPALLFYFLMRRPTVPFSAIFWLFISFIFARGITHMLEAIIFYQPIYRLSGVAKALTAAVSWTTVIALARIVPKALELPAIRAEHGKMKQEIMTRTQAEQKLATVRDQLEDRSATMTVLNRRLQTAMEAAGAIALQWELESGRILWHCGMRHWLEHQADDFTIWTDFLPAESFEKLRAACRAMEVSGEVDLDVTIDLPDGQTMRLAGVVDPKINDSPRTVTGMGRMV